MHTLQLKHDNTVIGLIQFKPIDANRVRIWVNTPNNCATVTRTLHTARSLYRKAIAAGYRLIGGAK